MRVDELYDSVAGEYEELINSPEANSKLAYNVKYIFDKYNITSGSILDIGCGPGNLKVTLGDNFNYTGIDFSEKMILKAKEKGYKTIYGNMSDCLRLIPDKSFDYSVSISALHFIRDIDFIISELNRISTKDWLITLANVTENYTKKFPINEPMYNHSKIVLSDVQEDVLFDAWNSPLTGERIIERMIFKKL
ncbi:MAG: class I SAM-dependent methyltransferase [Candidatus Paceibacterota bacterium]